MKNLTHGVVLHADFGIAPGLSRLEEGPPDIVIADQRQLQWQAGFFREAERGGVRGIGDAENEIGRRSREVTRQPPAQLAPRAIDRAAEDLAVRTGEIHILEDALSRL